MKPTYPLRYSRTYPETSEIPGQVLFRRQKQTPTNCRRLLKDPPASAPLAALPALPEIRPERVLYPWQQRGIQWALPRQGVNLWWVGGAGKSGAALWVALAHGGPILWTTMGHLRPNVVREIKKWSTVQPFVLAGKSGEIPRGTRLVVCSWQSLTGNKDSLSNFLRDGTFLLDEIHMAKAWKRAQKVIDPVTYKETWEDLENISAVTSKLARVADRRVGMTGTPIANNRADLWSQLDIIEPDCWGSNWDFVTRYCDAKKGEYGGLDTTGISNSEELRMRLNEITSVVKKQELQAVLPPMTRELLYLSPQEQCRPPAGMADWMRSQAKQGKQALIEARIAEAAARKRKWVVDFVTERAREGAKIVIFTGRRIDTEILGEAVKENVKAFENRLWIAHGEQSAEFRDQCAEAYMGASGPACLIGTIDSFGTGMNLQDTDDALFVMLPYTWKQLGQAEWRFTRPGQTRPVTIRYIVAAGTYDEQVVDLLLGKLDGVNMTIDDDDARGAEAVLAGDMNDEAIIKNLLTKV